MSKRKDPSGSAKKAHQLACLPCPRHAREVLPHPHNEAHGHIHTICARDHVAIKRLPSCIPLLIMLQEPLRARPTCVTFWLSHIPHQPLFLDIADYGAAAILHIVLLLYSSPQIFSRDPRIFSQYSASLQGVCAWQCAAAHELTACGIGSFFSLQKSEARCTSMGVIKIRLSFPGEVLANSYFACTSASEASHLTVTWLPRCPGCG